MKSIDKKAVNAQNDNTYLESFIKDNEAFIISVTSKITGKYITKSSEQWSVSLSAFCEAVKNYSLEKGGFYSFAELVIKRRLVDYIKSQSKYNNEISVNPYNFECDLTEDYEDKQISYSQIADISYTPKDDMKYEIESITEVLKQYNISFSQLVDVSPKSQKTKKACGVAIACIIKNPELFFELKTKKTLPIKKIRKISKLPQKILERHRKYIIAGAEIISGDYPYLSDYLKFIREEQNI